APAVRLDWPQRRAAVRAVSARRSDRGADLAAAEPDRRCGHRRDRQAMIVGNDVRARCKPSRGWAPPVEARLHQGEPMSTHSLSRRTFLAGTTLAGFATITQRGILAAPPAWAAAVAKVGDAAPGFTVSATTGKSVSLADQRGKLVILEWTNHDCPYVRKHYETGNMQSLQRETTAQGVVWLTLISSSPGTQGYVTPKQADDLTVTRKANPTSVLLDPTGAVGKTYGATNTPHMYLIDKNGLLLRAGAIDDRPTPRRADVQGAHNYVRAALEDVAAGRAVQTSVTRAYGCTVKYAESPTARDAFTTVADG